MHWRAILVYNGLTARNACILAVGCISQEFIVKRKRLPNLVKQDLGYAGTGAIVKQEQEQISPGHGLTTIYLLTAWNYIHSHEIRLLVCL